MTDHEKARIMLTELHDVTKCHIDVLTCNLADAVKDKRYGDAHMWKSKLDTYQDMTKTLDYCCAKYFPYSAN